MISEVGPNLTAALKNCLADQDSFFDGITRFEIIGARRISTSFIFRGNGRDEPREVWELEVFCHES
jgi:hypothetical protein